MAITRYNRGEIQPSIHPVEIKVTGKGILL
jgi:hypothetical protein